MCSLFLVKAAGNFTNMEPPRLLTAFLLGYFKVSRKLLGMVWGRAISGKDRAVVWVPSGATVLILHGVISGSQGVPPTCPASLTGGPEAHSQGIMN